MTGQRSGFSPSAAAWLLAVLPVGACSPAAEQLREERAIVDLATLRDAGEAVPSLTANVLVARVRGPLGEDETPVYVALERLATRGLVSSRFGEATPQRGGRRKKFYRLEPAGVTGLNRSYQTLTKMAAGLGTKLAQLAGGGVAKTAESSRCPVTARRSLPRRC